MLQRAASSAYSWWWASHIRTKQSKWLEENLQDMEEKISSMLKIIENNGDTFTQRVELYFRKRPELVEQVQEAYRNYRALAERYDHLSKEMQSANRTIAAVFPEQVQYTLEDYDEFSPSSSTASTPSVDPEKSPNLPKIFSRKIPTLKKEVSDKGDTSLNAAGLPITGLTKEEAQEEIVKIQKEMLALQTEREFLESICRRCNEKSGGIELQITDMQAKVGRLQEKFGFLHVIDDDEARSLMATKALESCQDAFNTLQEKHEQSAEKIEAENQRVKDIISKYSALRGEVLSDQGGTEVSIDEQETETESTDQQDSALLREKLNEELEIASSSSHPVMQLADRINELVEMVAGLETAVSSQDAQINVLRSETDGLQQQIKSLDEEKGILKDNAEKTSIKMKQLEEELIRVKSLSQSVKDQNESLQTHFTEAKCNIDHLSEKLQNANLNEELKNEAETVTRDYNVENVKTENHQEKQKEESIYPGEDKEQDSNQQEDNEKRLSDELGVVVRNYVEVKQRLNDVEKKNRDGFFELALQIRELKNELAVKDREIETLKTNKDHSDETNTAEFNRGGTSPESLVHTESPHDSDHWTTPTSPQHQIFDQTQTTQSLGDFAATLSSSEKEELDEIIRNTVSTIEDKLRTEIDESLEGNLEFWMRFSHSLNQVDKFRNSVKDLKAELAKLKASSQQEEANISKCQPIASETRAICKHLSQIQTELTLWLENNSSLKSETKTRNESLFKIQDEITKLSNPNPNDKQPGLHKYQAAKFLGEILNMKQESDKVNEELQASRTCIILLKEETEKTLARIDEELGIAGSKQGVRRSRVPLRTFLFGKKSKKQRSSKPSIFSRMQAGFQEGGNGSRNH